MILEPGTQIGDYRILTRIGKGTYGIVFEAEHVITQRIDALKVMLDAGCCSPEDEQRFLREIQIQASLQHPNIAAVYNAFRSDFGLVLVMERVPGVSLRTVLDRGKLPLAESLRYMREMLAGLAYAERAGVIHRDIKPENILIAPDGGVKLTDFGLAHVVNRARITGSGESLGTPTYISPEQVDGLGEVDARTNVYSTGVVLYEAVTGRTPFSGSNGFAVMRAHLETSPTPPVTLDPSIGDRLNAVILKALEKNPSNRFQSSAAFQAALLDATSPAPTAVRSGSKSRRFAAAVLAGAGACSATVAGGYWTFRQLSAAPAPLKTAAPAPAVPETQPAAPDPWIVPPGREPPSAGKGLPAADSSRQAQFQARKQGRVPAVRPFPASLLPRITGMPDESAAGEASQPVPPEPSRPALVVAMPAIGEACPAPPAAPPGPAHLSPAPSPEVPAAETRKRNAVVRALNKLFHKKAPPPPASPAGQPAAKPGDASWGPKPGR